MGSIYSTLFQGLWSRLFGLQEEFKICIIGLDNAGKTTILYRLHLGEVVSTNPTIGANVEEVVHNNIRFQMWDLGGQESLRQSWTVYFSNTAAVILVVDSTDRDRIHLVKAELHSRLLTNESLKGAKILVLANKQDRREALSATEISKQLELTKIKDHEWHIQGCCALTGEGLVDGLDWLTQKIKDRVSIVAAPTPKAVTQAQAQEQPGKSP